MSESFEGLKAWKKGCRLAVYNFTTQYDVRMRGAFKVVESADGRRTGAVTYHNALCVLTSAWGSIV